MKKQIRFEPERRPLVARFALSLLLAMLLAAVPAWMFWLTAEREVQASKKLEFAEYSSSRIELLREVIQIRVNMLKVLATTVPELKALDEERFTRLFEPLLQEIDTGSLCWHDLIRGDEFILPKEGGDCGAFKLFQSAALLTDGSPRLLLSAPAGDRDTVRSGFVSLLIDLGSVSTHNTHTAIEEYLYFDFEDSQKLQRFRLQNTGLVEANIQQQDERVEKRVSTVLSMPGLSIIYEAIDSREADSRPFLLGATAWLATVLVLLTLAISRWQNSALDREVARRTEELSQFGYRASHDLKSPLVSIRQLSDFVIEDIRAGKTESSIKDVMRIQSQATELEALVGEILDLSQADVNTDAGDKSAIDFNEILEAIRNRHIALIEERGTDLTFDLGAQLPTSGQYIRVVQILDNLISNAIKYIPVDRGSPSVDVSLSVLNSKLSIVVVDNGVGLGDAFYQSAGVKIFKRYHPQLASGSGIGLTIICKHIERLRGTIEFESFSHGSKIVVELPIDNKGLSREQL